jgi:hypothetical protein
MKNDLAYYYTKLITAVKSYIKQASAWRRQSLCYKKFLSYLQKARVFDLSKHVYSNIRTLVRNVT